MSICYNISFKQSVSKPLGNLARRKSPPSELCRGSPWALVWLGLREYSVLRNRTSFFFLFRAVGFEKKLIPVQLIFFETEVRFFLRNWSSVYQILKVFWFIPEDVNFAKTQAVIWITSLHYFYIAKSVVYACSKAAYHYIKRLRERWLKMRFLCFRSYARVVWRRSHGFRLS